MLREATSRSVRHKKSLTVSVSPRLDDSYPSGTVLPKFGPNSMTPEIETALTVLAWVVGGVGGWWLGKLPPPWPWVGYAGALGIVLVRAVVIRVPQFTDLAALRWADWGRAQFIWSTLVGTLLIASLAQQIPGLRVRRGLLVLAALLGFHSGVLPTASYLAHANQLAALPTRFWPDAVCQQSTDFTCGPAAAVTALRILGLQATEGELAQRCRTSPFAGTQGDILAAALRDQFAGDGLRADWRRFSDLEQLRTAGLTLVVVKYNTLLDHWLVVRSVTDTEVRFADPLSGLGAESHADFLKRWRRLGIRLRH